MRRLGLLVTLLLSAWLFWSQAAHAVVFVEPRTQFVNVSRTTSFVIRWFSDAGAFTVEPGSALFCVDYGGFVPGCRDILGRLPARLDQAPSGVVTSFEERLTVPTSIINRALNLARDRPENALIFFVRRLIPAATAINLGAGAGQPVWVQVNLRLTGSTAISPLAFHSVKIFGREPGKNEVRFVTVTDQNRDTGEIHAEIEYSGAGRVTGFWQIWTRNDPPLREIDRTPEGSLTEAQRITQRRFYRAMRIRENFGPRGRVTLKLPYSKLPLNDPGVILVFPFFELSRDRRSQSNLANFPGGRQIINSGPTGPIIPVLPVRISPPDGDPELLTLDMQVQRFEASAGTPAALGLVWSAVPDNPLVVEVTLSHSDGRVHRLIAPIAAGRAVFPTDWIDPAEASNGGLPPGYELSVAILGMDKQRFPGTEANILTGDSVN